MNKGHLVISLDFELAWGVFDKINLEEKERYFLNTRKIIPEILDLFSQHNIHCTWATVGMLLNRSWEEWEQHFPEKLPTYQNQKLSAYSFAEKHKEQEKEKYFFAPELVKKIISTPNQELATHTYAHYYCQEEGQNLEQFKSDLKAAIKVSQGYGVEMKSLVFPRNQFNEKYLKVCADLGIVTVRSNPDDWYWNDAKTNSLAAKIFRTGDAYNIRAPSKSYAFSVLKKEGNMPLAQRASRFLRPYEKNNLLHKLKMRKIKSEMKFAAKRKEIYHLWWHPHNFGDHPEESLKDLKELVEYYSILQKKFSFQSSSMREIAASI